MSLGDDQEGSGGYGGTGQTRTRYPEGSSDVYGGARRGGRSSSRSLVTVVGVVVLLIAAIAFANRGGDDGSSSAKGAGVAEVLVHGRQRDQAGAVHTGCDSHGLHA